MENVIIRQVREEESEKYLHLLKQLDEETDFILYEPGERKTTIEEMRSIIKASIDLSSPIFVAEVEHTLVGYLTTNRINANKVKHTVFIAVGILKEFTGKGIGTKFFNELETWAKNNGVIRIGLTVMVNNEQGIHLYKKKGFKIEGLKEKSIKIDGELIDEYYMAKFL